MRRSYALAAAAVTAIAGGFALAPQAAFAGGDYEPPQVTFNYAPDFVVGSALSDSSATPSVRSKLSWTQQDASGICREHGVVVDRETGAAVRTWDDIRTSVVVRLRVDHGYNVVLTESDCSPDRWGGTTTKFYALYTENIFQDDDGVDTAISFGPDGAWVRGRCDCWSGGSVMKSVKNGGGIDFVYETAGITLVTDRAPHRGTAKVYIDGKYVTTINDKGSTRRDRVISFNKSWSDVGQHEIELDDVTGRIDVDAILAYSSV